MNADWPWCSPESGISGTDRILGIDPGLRSTGFGVIETHAHGPVYLASGVIRTPAGDLTARLGAIYDGLAQIIAQYRPAQAAIEKVFVNVNPQSTLLLGQARGAAIAALHGGGVAVHEYTALQLKKSVTGHGHADKVQIQAMVVRLLALPARPSADAADALACALCHLHSRDLAGRLRSRAGGRGLRLRGGRLV